MRYIQKPCLDWEPLLLRLDFEQQAAPVSSAFQEQCVCQLRKRDAESDCACQLTFLHVVLAESDRIELLCEWLCPSCLPGLVNFLEQCFPGLCTVEAGHDEAVAVPQLESGFVEIDEQDVEFEDGTSVRVGPFKIARVATRTREFREFAEATGYRTSAERQEDFEWFLDNSVTVGLTKRELADMPVSCVSYNDAIAYCSWRGVQLPTEAQWLAAAIADSHIYSPAEYEKQRFWERGNRYLPELSIEWTRTIDPSGHGILRRGPRWARTTAWREEVREHRFAGALDSYDIMTTFRVVLVDWTANSRRALQ